MKIAFVSPRYPPFVGGIEYVVKSISERLAKLGHEVTVYTLDPTGKLPKAEQSNGVRVKRYLGVTAGYYWLPASFKFLLDLINERADIVHAHGLHSLAIFTVWLAKKTGAKWKLIVTTHYHGRGHSWHTNLLWKFYFPIVKKILQDANAVHVVSPWEAKLIKGRFQVLKSKLHFISNGVDEDVLRYTWSPPKHIRLTYAGRLDGYKRIDLLVEALPFLLKIDVDAELVIIGCGPDEPRLMHLATRLRVRDHVTLRPFLSRKQYLKEISRSTFFMNLSSVETYALSVAEALAIGTPVIITATSALTHYGGHRKVKLLPPDPTPKQVAQAVLTTVFKDKNRVRLLLWDEIVQEVLSVYKHVQL